MTNATPIIQPLLENIRNAAQIADAWKIAVDVASDETRSAFRDVARLLHLALAQLAEPNLSAMQAGEILLREWSGTPEPERQLRDTVAGILHAQVSGVVPKTWEVS